MQIRITRASSTGADVEQGVGGPVDMEASPALLQSSVVVVELQHESMESRWEEEEEEERLLTHGKGESPSLPFTSAFV